MAREGAVGRKLASMHWSYGEQDDGARRMLEERIVGVAQRRSLITYSELVRGVEFRLGNVRGGERFTIEDWTDHERAIVGDFLGMINAESYARDGIFLSALVVQKADGTPGKGSRTSWSRLARYAPGARR